MRFRSYILHGFAIFATRACFPCLNIKFKPLPRILQLLSSQNLQDFLNSWADIFIMSNLEGIFADLSITAPWVLTARRAWASSASALACHDNTLVADWPSLSLWYGDLCWNSCHSERPAQHFCRRQESVYPDQMSRTSTTQLIRNGTICMQKSQHNKLSELQQKPMTWEVGYVYWPGLLGASPEFSLSQASPCMEVVGCQRHQYF